ncbi:MAG: EAL domain-containing protein [Candidatus Thiodiazotropha sp.]
MPSDPRHVRHHCRPRHIIRDALGILRGSMLLGLLWLALIPLPATSLGAASQYKLLVIHSYSQEYPWTRGQHQGFVQTLKPEFGTQLTIESEYLDTKRISPTPEYIERFTRYLSAKYADYSPTAIYVTDDNALSYAWEYLPDLFPGTPIIFSGVNDLTVLNRLLGQPITGVIENKEIAPNLELLRDMNHHTGNLLVIGDNSNTYRAIEREIQQELSYRPDTHVTFIVDDRLEPILEELARHPDSDIFLTTLGGIKSADGQMLSPARTIQSIIEASGDRVIVSMEDGYVVEGVLGGYVTSSLHQGEAAARLMRDYLVTGILPAPIRKSPNEYLIDYRVLERHELQLPDAIRHLATLKHAPESFYQRYKQAILVTLYALTLLLLVSGASFLIILTRKNRLIEQRSQALDRQVQLTQRAKDSLDEAQRLAQQGSWEWDLRSGEFRRSVGLVHLYELCTDDAVGTLESFTQALDTEMRGAFESTVTQVRRTGEPVVYTHQLKNSQGEVRLLQETIRLIHEHKGGPGRLIGTVQDITEQHRTQRLLRENEEKYRRLFELSEDPMMLIIDRHISMANQSAAKALGFAHESELIGHLPDEFSPEKQPDGTDSGKKLEKMLASAKEQGYYRSEWKYLRHDGTPVESEASLTCIPYEGRDALYVIWRDVTEFKRIQNELKSQSAYLNGILSSSERVAIIATDPDANIQYYNHTAENLFNIPAEQAVGVNLLQIHRSQGVDEVRNQMGLGKAMQEGEYRFNMQLNKSDGEHHIDARISPIYRDNHEFAGYMLMCEDITEQRRASELIAYQASYDALTDLPNRRMFLDQLHQAVARTRRHNHKGAVLFFDLDNFKNINDSLGHTIGDDLLRQVAQRMRNAVREEDTVARLGGDEFVILMPELSKDPKETASEVQMVADKVRAEMTRPYPVDNHELHITTSIGIAIFPASQDTPDDILRQADTAMYRAKESGRNAVRFFLPSMQRAADERLNTLNELRQAIPRNELQVFYQAQFDSNRQLHGIEALLRWNHPTRGLVLPGSFIHQAEESSLILDIGDWVLQESLNQYKSWRIRYPQALKGRISVNVSALQFRQHDFIHRVERALGNTGADPSWLTLEMTESMLLEDFDETVEKIDHLKQLGVRFSIDDFGTGYSSLAYLKRLPVDEIKIDRSFVRDVIDDPNDATLVETVLTLVNHIGLEVIAEGVENEEIFQFLKQRSCHLYQGYYFSRPSDVDIFEQQHLAQTPSAPAQSGT